MTALRVAALFPLTLFFACGSIAETEPEPSSDKGDRTPAIVGGQHSTSFAATGSLYAQALKGHFCTATLVKPDRVLTAAHCFDGVPGYAINQVEFVLGNNVHGSTRRIRLKAAWVHPGYVKDDFSTGNDIAVAQLQAPVQGVQPVALHLSSPQTLMGQQLTLVGYGRSENDPTQGIRRETQVVLDEVQPKKISYAFVGKGGCFGDSGGPMFISINGGWWQLGITSHGTLNTPNCQERAYYNRIDVHAGWLAQYGIGNGDRPRQCGAGNACDGLCPTDPDCNFLWQGTPPGGGGGGGGGGGNPLPPSPPPPPPVNKKGFGQPCANHAECNSNICAVASNGQSLCTLMCGPGQSFCPSGTVCLDTQTPGVRICAPPHLASTPPPPPPPSKAGYGGMCSFDSQCVSGFCAAHPMGGGYCSWACDAYSPCPPGGRCFPTQYFDLFICGPPGW